MMDCRILVVANDQMLLETRSIILGKRWQVAAASSAEALRTLQQRGCELLVICHTVPRDEARELVQAVRGRQRGVRVLALEAYGESRLDLQPDASVSTANGPALMLNMIESLLAASNPAA